MGRGEGKELRINTVKFPLAAAAIITGLLTSRPPAGPFAALAVIWLLPCFITLPVLLQVPVEKTMHLPHHKLLEAPREEHRLIGAQPNSLANAEPPPTPSPAVSPVPRHSFKLMAPAQGPMIWLLER